MYDLFYFIYFVVGGGISKLCLNFYLSLETKCSIQFLAMLLIDFFEFKLNREDWLQLETPIDYLILLQKYNSKILNTIKLHTEYNTWNILYAKYNNCINWKVVLQKIKERRKVKIKIHKKAKRENSKFQTLLLFQTNINILQDH